MATFSFNEPIHCIILFGTITIIIALFLGGLILYRYIQTKDKLVLLFSFVIIFGILPWLPSKLMFYNWLITGGYLPYDICILIGISCLPIAIISWIIIYTETLFPKLKKLLITVVIVFSIIYYIYLIYFLYLAPDAPIKSLIAEEQSGFNLRFRGFILVYMIGGIFMVLITGIHFSVSCIKMKDNALFQYKGKFLLIGFICFAAGAIGDELFLILNYYALIPKILLMATSILFYLGFIMPKWLQKHLSLEDLSSTKPRKNHN